jgi:hypothetical protein
LIKLVHVWTELILCWTDHIHCSTELIFDLIEHIHDLTEPIPHDSELINLTNWTYPLTKKQQRNISQILQIIISSGTQPKMPSNQTPKYPPKNKLWTTISIHFTFFVIRDAKIFLIIVIAMYADEKVKKIVIYVLDIKSHSHLSLISDTIHASVCLCKFCHICKHVCSLHCCYHHHHTRCVPRRER